MDPAHPQPEQWVPLLLWSRRGSTQGGQGTGSGHTPARGAWMTQHGSLGGRSRASCWETMGSGGDCPHCGVWARLQGSGTRPLIATQGCVGSGRPHLPRPQGNEAIGASGEISRFPTLMLDSHFSGNTKGDRAGMSAGCFWASLTSDPWRETILLERCDHHGWAGWCGGYRDE